MGCIGFSKVKARLNCPTLIMANGYFCHSTNRSTSRGDEPRVEVLPLNCICAFQ